jgi:hypothetical protein
MELINKTLLQVKIGERTYSIECNATSPLGEVHDALTQMKAYVVDRMQAQIDSEKKCEDSECPK